MLLKGLIPRSREAEVSEDLRGWNWHRPPLEPLHDVKLAMYEIASQYCPTGRDVYLRRVQGIKPRPNVPMLMGALFHETLVRILVKAKRLIYQEGVEQYRRIIEELRQPDVSNLLETYGSQLGSEQFEEARQKVLLIWDFEASRLIARIQECLTRQPYIGEDSLVSLAVPVVVEQKLDGSFLGLSQNLSADAFTFSEPMVLDLKFGERQKFHRLSTIGYGLVMEALHEYPVNIGTVIYVEFRGNRLVIKKDFHLLDDELRQWFIEERDERMRMIVEELDPGLPPECYSLCPFMRTCHGDG